MPLGTGKEGRSAELSWPLGHPAVVVEGYTDGGGGLSRDVPGGSALKKIWSL